MTADSRETAGAVRSAHVAYFLPPDWGRIARHIAPALERSLGESPAVRLLVLVPDATAAVELTRALTALPAAVGRRVLAATSPARLQRLLGLGPADAVVGAAEVLAGALSASALKLGDVRAVVFAAADEMHADSDALAAVLSEVPRDATRLLTALAPTAGVEAVIERYMHRARRVTEDVIPAAGAARAPMVRYLTVTGSPIDALPALLDELDAPSAAVLAGDQQAADAARSLLASIGYVPGPLADVTLGEVQPNTSLVVTLGVPTATAWQQAVDAQPAQIVTVCAPRDLEALRLLAGDATPRPLSDRASISRARAAESRRRAELRAELAEGIPSREVLALEPLLREYDGLEIAAAALRVLERTRAAQAEQVQAAEQRVRSQMREAQKEREAEERSGAKRGFGDRPRSGFSRGPDRGPDRGDRGDRGERGDRPRGGPPRDRADRGERGGRPSFGSRPPRGEGFGRGERSDRGDRGDRPRGPRPPRDDR